MPPPDPAWESRSAALWADIDRHAPEDFVALVEALAAELPAGSAVALFERACAQDSTGHPDEAVPLYRQALQSGLTGLRRRRATIQLASSLRNLGDAAAAVDLLAAELAQPPDELSGAVRGFLALALADTGRAREALASSLEALAACLPRYNNSLARYAAALLPGPRAPAGAQDAQDVAGSVVRTLVLYSLAEVQAGHADTIHVVAHGRAFSVADNGRGHAPDRQVDGVPYLRLVYEQSDFPFGASPGPAVQLQGLGTSMIRALCDPFAVTSCREGVVHRTDFAGDQRRSSSRPAAAGEGRGNTVAGTLLPWSPGPGVDLDGLARWLGGVQAATPGLRLLLNGAEVAIANGSGAGQDGASGPG